MHPPDSSGGFFILESFNNNKHGMKQFLPIVLLLFIVQSLAAQVFERRYLEHQNQTRTYLIYVPSTYDENSGDDVPVIFAFHGINATDENLAGVGLNTYAEQHNFIVIYPQAIEVELGFIAWNCGTVLASNVDDLGFFNTMLDLTMEQYSVDDHRVYVCGYSLGGMMANRIACEYGNRVAALASVSGPLTNTVYHNCEPVRKMPVMHFHGLSDQTVAYFGSGLIGTKGAMATMYWWAERNGCNEDYELYAVPDTADEWYHVDRLTFPECDDPYEMIHYRIEHWPHAWPGPSRNIFATDEIVKFFMRHELIEADIITASYDLEYENFTPHPNPFQDALDLSMLQELGKVQWEIYNTDGRLVVGGNQGKVLDTSSWSTGVYVLHVAAGQLENSFKIIKY